MASIVLSAAGAAIGNSVGGPLGAFIGARIGQAVGGSIDQSLAGGRRLSDSHGPRLADLSVQTSTYGKTIPIVYGNARIAGNVIWSRPIRETATTTTVTSGGGGGKGGGGKVSQDQTTYSYSVSLAIAICEGPIDAVFRIWADAKLLNMSQVSIRTYLGTETQGADSLIQAFEGVGRTPAYRGLAYVVLENFPLADYGNRIPNFTFEVRRRMPYPDHQGRILENEIKSMVLIPGAGEFVYDTLVQTKIPGADSGAGWAQQGNRVLINRHTPYEAANVKVALTQLQQTCPNVEWVSVVVGWFGNSLDAGACILKPGVEYQTGGATSPATWNVAGYTRAAARQITMVGGSPQYGGTPSDMSVVRLLAELRARGYKIMFYPMPFMDVAGKPWRGHLTGSAADVSAFFTKSQGYNAFVLHYANLVAGKVEGFAIGSEMVGLTKVTDTPGNYPAVNRLVSLAASVKSILGAGVKVTYAADWSEYHHAEGGWYNLDPLWASSSIDVIGIDAYFPLQDSAENSYDIDTLKAGWTSGEGYDWYYTDSERTILAPLAPAYAWKNLAWFWSNTHTNPNGSATAWVPGSKKIWFTEFGFPSVDNASNQPNVFFDPSTSGSAFPYHSKGRVDFRAQRAAMMATLEQWRGSPMVERMFAWTWDARPYPYWPDLTNVWSDGQAWKTGHWLQGKLGVSSLAAIVAHLCARVGLEEDAIDVSRIREQVEGFVIVSQQTARLSIEQLQRGYFFDSVESDGRLKFTPRGQAAVCALDEEDFVPEERQGRQSQVEVTRAQEVELPSRVQVVYLNRLQNYQPAVQYAAREVTESRENLTLDVSIVLSDQAARNVADVALYSAWVGRTSYRFQLPVRFAYLEPGDVVALALDGAEHRVRITGTRLGAPGVLRVQGVAELPSAYDFYRTPAEAESNAEQYVPPAETAALLLDIPAFPGDDAVIANLRVAASGISANWPGASLLRSDGTGEYARVADLSVPSIFGTVTNVLSAGSCQVFDRVSSVTVSLLGEAELSSAPEISVLNGANAALVGNEILQFTTATLLAPSQYRLEGLLRGRLGTEWAVGSHAAGERFVLLGGALAKAPMAPGLFHLARTYKAVTSGAALTEAEDQHFTYRAVALKPYSPVHVEGIRDSGGNLTIRWIRRTRIGGEWNDHVDVPLSEAFERYELDVLDGADVVRTLMVSDATSAAYSAVQQAADFGAPQASVTVRVYQISALIGRGFPAEAEL